MRILLALLSFGLLCGTATAQSRPWTAASSGVIAVVPPDSGEHDFVPFAREYGQRLGLPDLRHATLAPDDLEVRLWSGFGLTGVHLLRLERQDGRWRATEFHPDRVGSDSLGRAFPDSVAWVQRWMRAIDAGLLALPAVPQRNDPRMIADGHSFVVEYRLQDRYGTAGADNPAIYCSADDRQLLRVVGELLGQVEECRPMHR
jgi:hypothetical protein